MSEYSKFSHIPPDGRGKAPGNVKMNMTDKTHKL